MQVNLMKDHLQVVYQHDPSIVSRMIAGEMILVPIKNRLGDMESIYTLNETAARVWELSDGRHTIADIHQQILAEFEVDSLQAEQDVIELIGVLEAEGALVKV